MMTASGNENSSLHRELYYPCSFLPFCSLSFCARTHTRVLFHHRCHDDNDDDEDEERKHTYKIQ